MIKALSMRDLALALAGHFVKDFMSIGYSRFLENLLFPRRQGNNVVHALIKGVSFSFLLQVWMEDIPPNILHYVVEDFPT